MDFTILFEKYKCESFKLRSNLKRRKLDNNIYGLQY
nr:MAG TPA: hypothetical protein [Caudoviricetes sp.]